MPRNVKVVQNRPANVPLVIAHRGASGYRPEHTRSAFTLALDLKVDAVEPDLVVSSDGVLVIRHENELSKTTDVGSRAEFADRRASKTVDGAPRTGWFTEDFTWAELSTLRAKERLPEIRPGNIAFEDLEPILRFEDLLELVNAHGHVVDMVIEIKHASYFTDLGLGLDELLASALTKAGWTDDPRLTIESFELTFLEKLRRRGVRARLVYLIKAIGSPPDRPNVSFASSLTEKGLSALSSVVDGIGVDKNLILTTDDTGAATVTDLVARARAAGLLIYCWTLRAENRFLAPQHRIGGAEWGIGNWPAEFGLLLASGIDGVFADQPDLAIEAREKVLAG